MPPPITLSVETPPSRPDLAMAPLPSLTLLQPHWGPARRDGPLFSNSPASGPSHWLFPCLTSQPAPRLHLPGVFAQCHLPGRPPPILPHGIPHPSAFAAVTRRVTLGIPSVSLCRLLPTSVPRLCGCTGHLAASLATLPECQHAHQTNRARSGAPEVRHPQGGPSDPEWGF